MEKNTEASHISAISIALTRKLGLRINSPKNSKVIGGLTYKLEVLEKWSSII